MQRAAIIGLGPHGKRIAAALSELPDIQVSAVVDRRQDVLDSCGLLTSVKRVPSLDDLWTLGTPEIVCIATNGPTHASIAIEAMKRGVRRLLIAKPMACSLNECQEILGWAERTGTRIAVDHVRRHAPGYVWLRDQIAAGRWGAVRCIWTQRSGIGLGCLATHSFDAVRYLTGMNVTAVTAWVDAPIAKNPRGSEFVDPGGLVVLQLDNARAIVTQIEDGAGPTALEIDLTAGRIRLDERAGVIEVIERDMSVSPMPGRPAQYQQVDVPQGLSGKVDMHLGLVALLTQLASVGPLDCDASHGMASVEVLVAAHLSHHRGNVPIRISGDDSELQQLWLPVT